MNDAVHIAAMSSRQLRKLQKQRELQELEARAAAEDEGSESDNEVPIQKPKANLFSGFAALGGDEDQDDDDDDDEPEPEQEKPERVETPKPSSKKNKKKKKKAKKAAAAAALEDTAGKTTSSGPNEKSAKATTPDDGVDEIDQAIRELNLKAQASGKAAAAGGGGGEDGTGPAAVAYERICELLRVNTHHLKVVNEMRNLFGREAIAAAQTEEQENEQGRARRRGLQQALRRQNVDLETFLKGAPGRSLPEVTLRRNPFLPGKETWPRASTDGLTMRTLRGDGDGTADTRGGAVEFAFAHDDQYNNLERQFFQLVQMYDPMQLVYFLHRHPYHVSSLIQVSKVAKQDQNSALAGDLCERALFTFGRVSLSAFRQKMEEGKARLEFRRPENRQFWLAGYHYLKSLTMKGTYRTALEWTKLLLSMDLSDPYGMIHFLHPLAIRAHESKWFIDFCDSEALDECDTAQDYIRQTLVLARLQQKDAAGAKALAVEGMERLPWLYSSIFKSLNLDVPKAIWGMQPRDDHEALFTELYIHQTKQLWDNPQTTSLLKEAASLAQKPSLDSLPPAPTAGRNVGRFVYLDNTPALMGLVPGGMLHGFPNWDFDPLPPTAEENIFSYESQRLPWNPDRSSDLRLGDLNLERMGGRNALQRMLQQMMQQGAPAELRQQLEEAIAQLGLQGQGEGAEEGEGEGEGDAGVNTAAHDEDSDSDGDREASPRQDGQQGLWQAFMDMVWPVRSSRQDDDDSDDYQNFDATPGAWPSDSDDDGDGMPVVIYEDVDEGDPNGNAEPANYRRPQVEEDENTD